MNQEEIEKIKLKYKGEIQVFNKNGSGFDFIMKNCAEDREFPKIVFPTSEGNYHIDLEEIAKDQEVIGETFLWESKFEVAYGIRDYCKGFIKAVEKLNPDFLPEVQDKLKNLNTYLKEQFGK